MIRTRPAPTLLALLSPPRPPAPAADTGRAFTLEDLYRTKGVGEPAISPDGKTIVYTVATNDWAAKKKTVALWRADADGANARPLTSGDARDEHPFFSPDGKTLAFVSTRSGEPQVFFLPLGGGEAEQKTRFPGGVDSPALLEGRPVRRLRRGRLPRLRRGRGLQQEGVRRAGREQDQGAPRRLAPLPPLDGLEGRQAHARLPPRPRRGGRGQGRPRPDARRLRLARLLRGRRERLRPLAGRKGDRVLVEPRRGRGVLDERGRLDRPRDGRRGRAFAPRRTSPRRTRASTVRRVTRRTESSSRSSGSSRRGTRPTASGSSSATARPAPSAISPRPSTTTSAISSSRRTAAGSSSRPR